MSFFYTLFISFLLVFFSELGDKTWLIVLSFSTKLKTSVVLLGVAIGSLFSHGIAIALGSFLGNINDSFLHIIFKCISYFSFIVLGILSFSHSKKSISSNNFIYTLPNFKTSHVIIVALIIAIGELGDKTFLSSIGLAINYPYYMFSLILGAVLGMIFSDLVVILLGKLLTKKIPEKIITNFSGILFITFGIIGFISLL